MVKRSREASSSPSPSPSPTTSHSSAILDPTNHHHSSPAPPKSNSSTTETNFNSHTSKYRHISPEALPSGTRTARVMKCSLPPHLETLEFSTFEAFEIHYIQSHVNRCSECRRNFPTEHFLGLHIAENHDPLSEARRERGEKTYTCFLPSCPKICANPTKRRMHLIDKHLFPKNYDFLIVNSGIDKRSSMLRNPHHRHRRLSSAAASRARFSSGSNSNSSGGGSSSSKPHHHHESTLPLQVNQTNNNQDDIPMISRISSETTSQEDFSTISFNNHNKSIRKPPTTHHHHPAPSSINNDDTSLEDLTTTMSTLRFVPPSVRFGRGGGGRRGGLSRS